MSVILLLRTPLHDAACVRTLAKMFIVFEMISFMLKKLSCCVVTSNVYSQQAHI